MRVYIQNFRNYSGSKPYVFNFGSDELVCLTGQSGAGKSTLFMAIKWCLYGGGRGNQIKPTTQSTPIKPSDEPSDISLLRSFSVSPQATAVAICFGDSVVCRRASATSALSIDPQCGNRISGSAAEAWIEKRFGTCDAWRASSYLSQGGINALLSKSNAERFELVYELAFGTPIRSGSARDIDPNEADPTPFIQAFVDAHVASKRAYRDMVTKTATLRESANIVSLEACPPLSAHLLGKIDSANISDSLRNVIEESNRQLSEKTAARNALSVLRGRLSALKEVMGVTATNEEVEALREQYRNATVSKDRLQNSLARAEKVRAVVSKIETVDSAFEELSKCEQARRFYEATKHFAVYGMTALEAKNALKVRRVLIQIEPHAHKILSTVSNDETDCVNYCKDVLHGVALVCSKKQARENAKLAALLEKLSCPNASLDQLKREAARIEAFSSAREMFKSLAKSGEAIKCENCKYPIRESTLGKAPPKAHTKTLEEAIEVSERLRLLDAPSSKKIPPGKEPVCEIELSGHAAVALAAILDGQRSIECRAQVVCGALKLKDACVDEIEAAVSQFEDDYVPVNCTAASENQARIQLEAAKRELEVALDGRSAEEWLSESTLDESQLRNELQEAIESAAAIKSEYETKKTAFENSKSAEKAIESQQVEIDALVRSLERMSSGSLTADEKKQCEERLKWEESNARISKLSDRVVAAECEERALLQRATVAENVLKRVVDTVNDVLRKTVDTIVASANFVLADLFSSDPPMFIGMSIVPSKTRSGASSAFTVAGNALTLEIHYRDVVYDGASLLSGGETDRLSLALTIAIARTTRSKFVLMDECFSSLDDETQSLCLQAVRKFLPDQLVINVSHSAVVGAYDRALKIVKE